MSGERYVDHGAPAPTPSLPGKPPARAFRTDALIVRGLNDRVVKVLCASPSGFVSLPPLERAA